MRELGRALAAVHTVRTERLAELPSVFNRSGGSQEILGGPLAAEVRSRWSQVVTSPEVLTHFDYWSGNVVWRDGRFTGIVDWSGGSRSPRGFDLGWCRLDLVLLFDEQTSDDFLAAYEAGTGQAVGEMRLWAAGPSLGPMTRLGPGPRTTFRWAAPTSMKINFGDAMRNGRHASESGRKPQPPQVRLPSPSWGKKGACRCW